MKKKMMDLLSGKLVPVKTETEIIQLLKSIFNKDYPNFNVEQEVKKVVTLLHQCDSDIKYITIGCYMGIDLCAFVTEEPKKLKHGETSYLCAYVSNPLIPEFSEPGDIVVKNINGENYYQLY